MIKMMLLKILLNVVVFSVLILTTVHSTIYDVEKYILNMPNVQPEKSDQYLCTPVKVNPSLSYYIIGFQPNASMNTVHHMILYGCKRPGLSKPFWNCGEMSTLDMQNNEGYANPCRDGNLIIYAWARDAPMLKLPDDVAFKVGKDTDILYLVLQVHYNHVEHFKDGAVDNSGVILHYTENPMPRLAGVLLMGTAGEIQPYSLESMETACLIREDKVIHPFAFRTHTHELGVRVVGYRVRRKNGMLHWTMIGERDPMDPQMFYEVEKPLIIKKDDYVAAACKMDATKRDRVTRVGATSKNEMCNFYMMYWVEDSAPLDKQYCFTSGPPFYYWTQDFEDIPEIEKLAYRKTET